MKRLYLNLVILGLCLGFYHCKGPQEGKMYTEKEESMEKSEVLTSETPEGNATFDN